VSTKARERILFVFIDEDPGNLYQIKQWRQTLNRLNKEFAIGILYRSKLVEDVLADSELTLYKFKSERELIQVLDYLKPKVLLYPNQNVRNFFPLRFREAIHVFVSHGESDKAYMYQNTIKRYDLYFGAGQAAKKRIANNVWNYDVDKRIKLIGRPQLNDVNPLPYSPKLKHDYRWKILYAPTWEGVTRATRYSSIVSHANQMVHEFNKASDCMLAYRPHPLTGSREVKFKEANREIIDYIKNSSSVFFDDSDFGWHLNYFDLLITDVSAVAYDWIATGKPILITLPEDREAKVQASPILETVRTLNLKEVPDIIKIVEESILNSRESTSKIGNLRAQYFREPVAKSDIFIKEALDEALSLQSELSSSSEENQLVAFYRFSLKRLIMRYCNIVAKLMLIKVHSRNLKRELERKGSNESIYVFFSDPFDKQFKSRLIRVIGNNTGGELVTVITNQMSSSSTLYFSKQYRKWKRKGLLRVLTINGPADCERVLSKLRPKNTIYLKHHHLNHMLLRLNGTNHILMEPELDTGVQIDHSIVVYDEIISLSENVISEINMLHQISKPKLKMKFKNHESA